MNVSTALSQISSINSKMDSIFSQLESLLPPLTYKSDKTSFAQLKNAISSVSSCLSSVKGPGNITNFGEKYTPIFDKLNEKIKDLKSLDEMIAEVKEDSEQMELIALNAMVISVKSGEKGLAFSKITENLQRLSKDMFVYSDKLSEEEAELLEQINELKTIFSGIIESQNSISSKDSECISAVQRLYSSVNENISSLSSTIDSIYPAIEQTSGILDSRTQFQNDFRIIANALSSAASASSVTSNYEAELDLLSYTIELYEKVYDRLSKISSSFSGLCSTFAGNWQEVIEIMEKADSMRMDFESRFLNNHAFGNDNISKQVELITEKYNSMIHDFNNYHSVQKDLQGTCHNITTKAKTIYAVFENLRPVMSRLHHVRILQQIEVSKNDAIKSVQDSVTDMDNLINSANNSLDGIQNILESFIQETGTMLSNFLVSITKDNDHMVTIRNEKEVTFGDLQNSQSVIGEAFHNFTVFPDEFQKQCVSVQHNLQEFMRLNSELSNLTGELETEKNTLQTRKSSLMAENGLSRWTIKNPNYITSLSKL